MKKGNTVMEVVKKVASTPSDKFLVDVLGPDQRDSLTVWGQIYFNIHVKGAPEKTIKAKTADMGKFLQFFNRTFGHDHADTWTPAISRGFQKELQTTILNGAGDTYAPSTINRIIATVKHFGRWLHHQRPLLAGDPFAGVKDIEIDHPAWSGLNDREIMHLKAACEIRMKACTRKDQNPYLETAVFYALLYTGLRESELAGLNRDQYHHKNFHNVKRKGNRVHKKIPVPTAAREKIDAYLNSSPTTSKALFVTRFGNQLSPDSIRFICERVTEQASAHLPEKIHLTPHMLRHTFLKRVADKKGVHYAQEMSGNKSTKVIFRYTKPSPEEIEETAEDLFNGI
jgi:integrase/recombinase XerD